MPVKPAGRLIAAVAMAFWAMLPVKSTVLSVTTR
jgi:hypothetical protein